MLTITVSICLSRFGLFSALTVRSSSTPVALSSTLSWNLRTASATLAS
jgi:hypothetical protein